MHENEKTQNDEITVTELILKFKKGINFIKSKWIIILFCALVGGGLGLIYSILKKAEYTARYTFVLEDKSSGGGALSQYSGLAALAGIDIGGSSDGMFSGDNIFELYKSRLMIEKTLLDEVDVNGKKQLLIDRYINSNKLRSRWRNKDNIDSITFNGDPQKFTRKQDSIITDLVEVINKKNLDVKKADKKLSIIEVDVKSTDELFSKGFADKLVENVNEFYTQTKTKKSYQNLQTLQKQADSVKAILNMSINGVASALDAAPNANPALLSLRVPSQRKQIDVQANTAIYTEIIKNLEISKVSFRQEKPLIQVIDPPVLPLAIDRLGKVKGFVIGMLLTGSLALVLIFVKKYIF
jgi:uncharacterized protein involved in exopolysaccharide biosynthesis